MKNRIIVKGLVTGIICLLMLVSFPMVTGEDILYPKEEGPYNVLISGKCTGMGGRLYPMFLHPSPLWLLVYPLSIEWHFYEDYVFFVNGEKQDIDYRVQIDLTGFKGYGPSFYMLLLKEKVRWSTLSLRLPSTIIRRVWAAPAQPAQAPARRQ